MQLQRFLYFFSFFILYIRQGPSEKVSFKYSIVFQLINV